jgi:hypothetical protein
VTSSSPSIADRTGTGWLERPADAVAGAITAHLLDTLTRVAVDSTPFSHIRIESAFPAELYTALLDHLPGIEHYDADNPKKYGKAAARIPHAARPAGLRDPISCRYLMPLRDDRLAALPRAIQPLWTGVARALTSEAVKARLFDLFADDLCRRFGTGRAGLAALPAYPRPSLIRDLSGYWIEPHPDSPAKLVTMQFYLARGDDQRALGTSLYRRHLFDPRNLLSLDHLFENVRQMPFLPNSGYAFPVGRRSWHGREEVPEALGERHSILLFYFRDPARW